MKTGLFGICIATRIGIAWLSRRPEFQFPIGVTAALISIGFAVIYIFGLRKTGVETFGKPIWWNEMRPIHSVFYGIFAIYTLNGIDASGLILFDTLLGMIARDTLTS